MFPLKYGRLFDHLRLSAFTFHSLPSPPPLPRPQRKVLTVRRHPSALSVVAQGRLAWTTWDSAHFPALIIPACSAGTGPCRSDLRRLRFPLSLFSHSSSPSSPPPLPDPVFDSVDDVCYVHMCDRGVTSAPADFGKAEFDEHKCLIEEPALWDSLTGLLPPVRLLKIDFCGQKKPTNILFLL